MRCAWSLLAVGLAGLLVARLHGQENAAAELSRLIDQQINARLTAEKLAASPAADDAELVRRLYLDLHGLVPTAEQTAAFLDDSHSQKRARLVESLVENPAYGRHLADLWDGLLLPVNATNRKVPVKPLNAWLAQAFNENRPWNETVYAVITAVGPQNENAAVTPFMANAKSLAPHEATDLVTRLFLGVQLACAQCHDHPFDRWKQTDYWGIAAFFDKLHFTSKFEGLETTARAQGKGNKAIDGTNYGITEIVNPKKHMLPERAKPSLPRLLTGEQPDIDPQSPPLRPVFAAWLTAAENPWFARAIVNRTWGMLFGRGLVNPVDDMRDKNPPTHPELLDALTREFVGHGFDLKYLVRGICQSEAYQRTSRPTAGNEADSQLYSRMPAKVLSPEQMFDSLAVVLGAEALSEGKPVDDTRDRFVQFFETDDEPDPIAYRRGIPQLLKLMNHTGYQRAVTEAAARVAADQTPPQAIEQVYLLALSRRPAADEMDRMLDFVKRHQGTVPQASADILWVLLNSSEFALNH